MPIIRTRYEDLTAKIQLLEKTPDLSNTPELSLWSFLQALEYNVRRTVILELNVCRVRGLLGEGSVNDQFNRFKERFEERQNCLFFYEKYPLLSKYAWVATRNWLDASYELLERLSRDWTLITKTFGVPNSASISEIQSGGDTHNRGRTVATLTFHGNHKVIYKPRSVRLEKHFFGLLHWLNKTKENFLPFRTLNVLDQTQYGWVEFCEYEEAQTPLEVESFYYRLGALSAIIYGLHGVDIFFENVIACRDQPMIIDLETLLHTDLELKDAANIKEAADFNLRDSILSMGIFPKPSLSASGQSVFCVSVLGAEQDLEAPYSVTRLENFGRSDMRLDSVPGWIPEAKSSPNLFLEKKAIVENISKGFCRTYEIISNYKSEFLDPGGVLDQMKNIRSRVIVRDTIYYGGLEMDSFHPDLLRDGLDKDWHYDNLWAETIPRPYLESFIASEKRQIYNHDIPYFEMETGTSSIFDDQTKVYDFDQTLSGWEKARERIWHLSTTDLERQNYLIHLSLGSGRDYFRRTLRLSKTDYMGNAIAIGDFLLLRLIYFEDKATFIVAADLIPTAHHINYKYTIQNSNSSIYDGVAGLSLFFCYLSQNTGDTRYREAALSLARTAFAQVDKLESVSSYNGLGANIYLSAHLFNVFDEEWILQAGSISVNKLSEKVYQDGNYDLLLGSSGAILSLLSFIHVTKSEPAEHALSKLIIHLVEAIRSEDLQSKLSYKRGYSHGYSGVAYVLAMIFQYTGDRSFSELAYDLLEIEDDLLRNDAWTDEHKIDGKCQVSWCHGSAGISLARANVKHLLGPGKDDATLIAAVEDLKNNFWLNSHCLCHGTIGNLEILSEICSLDSDLVSDFVRKDFERNVFAQIAANGWTSITEEQSMNLGLMTGLSGLGYSYLRHAIDHRFPSILTMQKPFL